MNGMLIVLEGIDGCGKSTQIQHLYKWLPNSGLMPPEAKLHITREPGGTSLGKSLRELLLNPSEEKSPQPLTELLLYAADRAQHISEIIQPLINQGDWAISDRFSGSTLAYQGYGRGLNIKTIEILEEIALQTLKPDLTLWIDIATQESIRRRGRKPNDRIESEGYEFLKEVANGFHRIALERHWVRIEGDLNPDLVSQKIEKEVKEFFITKFAPKT